ncbi:hypothetical protein BDZ97DRAFT_1882542 [Flammula alnicola]|nr:hypothetical protein BDZ97DRAFT_1882542 [Flammula alnicola]
MSTGGDNFSHLIRSNAVPSLHERNLVRGLISDLDNDISKVDLTIAELRKRMNGFENQRTELTERRATYASIVSPLRYIPLEILGHIFIYASADDTSFELCASHVCRLWREASLATSELWSTIKVGFVSFPSELSLEKYIETYIHRARSRPLSLIYKHHRVPYDPTGVIRKVAKDCQWKVISLTSTKMSFPPIIKSLMATSWDVLESLTLDGCKDGFSTVESRSRESKADLRLISASRLTKLRIAVYSPIDSRILQAPWSQLTELYLKMTSASRRKILDILRQSSKLEIFTLNADDFENLDDALADRIHLKRLRKLHFHSHSLLVSRITDALETPNLEDLVVDARYKPRDFSNENSRLKNYLKHWAPPLRRLWLSGVGSEDIKALVPVLKELEELTLVTLEDEDMVFPQDILSPLTIRHGPKKKVDDWSQESNDSDDSDDSDDDIEYYYYYETKDYSVPLPKLKVLKVIDQALPKHQEAFIRLVQSRWWPDEEDVNPRPFVRLRSASFQNRNEDHRAAVADQVEALSKEGLDINVLMPREGEFVPCFQTSDA